jgi:hypothetical protein
VVLRLVGKAFERSQGSVVNVAARLLGCSVMDGGGDSSPEAPSIGGFVGTCRSQT